MFGCRLTVANMDCAEIWISLRCHAVSATGPPQEMNRQAQSAKSCEVLKRQAQAAPPASWLRLAGELAICKGELRRPVPSHGRIQLVAALCTELPLYLQRCSVLPPSPQEGCLVFLQSSE